MNKQRQTSLAFLLSILLHGALIAYLAVTEYQQIAPEKEELAVEWVELTPSEDAIEERQIVEQDKTINDEVPEEDYRLSQSNQDVAKETRAEKNGQFQNKKNQVDGQAKAATPTAKQQVLNQFKPDIMGGQYSMAKIAPPPEPALSGSEVSQSDDYLEDVVAGAETLLKTREFVYYSYYNRIKRKLRQHWEPRIKKKIVKIIRKGRRIASVNDKVTRLIITLDQAGELVRIQVKNASGYNDLDDAAIEAFRAAAPFPNPPAGIVSQTGVVEINWDFVLET